MEIMTPPNLEHLLEPADVILAHVAPTGNVFDDFFRYWIRRTTRSIWSHSILYRGMGNTFEAVAGGVIKGDLRKLEDGIMVGIYRHKDMTDEKREKILRKTSTTVGIPYDFKRLRKMLWKIKGDGRDNDNVAEYGKWSCDTLISKAYYDEGLYVKSNIHWSQVVPADFARSGFFNEIGFWYKREKR